MRVCFFFNAQRHQLLHGLPTAVALARMPGFEVHVASPAPGHIAYARDLAARLGGAPIVFTLATSAVLDLARTRSGACIPPKLLTLARLAPWLNRFDAVALPERTSIILKRLGVRRPKFIHLDHGAGDRAAGFDRRIRHFDFVLMAGAKHAARLAAEGLIRDGDHAQVGYPKFAGADAARDPAWSPFDGTRPIILYNPHFCPLGSWEAMGAEVLAAFAAQDRYDLIVAPHVRLLDGKQSAARWAALLDGYEGHPRIHIDRGSDRSIDMTHVELADLYLGDVSSQVYEFLRRPRPCLFLDPHGIDWQGDENYAHWQFGPVLRDAAATGTGGLIGAIDDAFATHDCYRDVQQAAFTHTFGTDAEDGPRRAATAIAGWLEKAVARPPARPRARRLAVTLATLAAGWVLHDLSSGHAVAAPGFVDTAATAHRSTMLRVAAGGIAWDPARIARATGIALPALPAGWRVDDVRLYPVAGGSGVQLAVTTAAGERLSLIAQRGETPAGDAPLLDSRADERVAYWEEGPLAFALVGRMPSARLLSLAAGLAAL